MDKASDITIGNIVTWALVVGSWIVFIVTIKYKVETLETRRVEDKKSNDERFDRQDKVLEEIKTQGSPASRSNTMLINSRLDAHAQRLAKIEEAIIGITAMQSDMKWISKWAQKQMEK